MVTKITELTEAQTARFPEWRERYTAKQLWTGETDRPRAEVAATELYKLVGELPPIIAHVRSPLVASVAGAMAAAIHWGRETGWGLTRARELKAARAALAQAYDRLYASPFYQTTGELMSRDPGAAGPPVLGDPAGRQRLFDETIRAIVELTPVGTSYPAREIAPDDRPETGHYDAMMELMRECLTKVWRLRNFGCQQIAWIAHLTFLRDVCELELPEYAAFHWYEELAECSGYRITHKWFCAISDPPGVLKAEPRDGVYTLHNPGGAAQSWRDGWSLYYLNGVRVPAWMVLLPEGQLDPRWVARIDNAEERREFVRRVGIERIEYKLGGKVIEADPDGMYQLVDLKLGPEDSYRPYLKMRNPSIDATHLEGVHPDCRTIQAALNFRNDFTPDQVDDARGVDWWQQGDVTIKPVGAKLFKSRPAILT